MVSDPQSPSQQLFVDLAAIGGAMDDLVGVTVEIGNPPGDDDTHVPVVHLHIDESNLAASFYKKGDGYLVRAETDVSIRPCRLPDGSSGYWLG